MMLRRFRNAVDATIDLGIILTIVIAFVGLMVITYIIGKVPLSMQPGAPVGKAQWQFWNTSKNLTENWTSQVSLIIVAITIFVLSLAISALIMLRGRND